MTPLITGSACMVISCRRSSSASLSLASSNRGSSKVSIWTGDFFIVHSLPPYSGGPRANASSGCFSATRTYPHDLLFHGHHCDRSTASRRRRRILEAVVTICPAVRHLQARCLVGIVAERGVSVIPLSCDGFNATRRGVSVLAGIKVCLLNPMTSRTHGYQKVRPITGDRRTVLSHTVVNPVS